MPATSPHDLRLLRLVRARPTHAYALASHLGGEPGGPDRATVYRRLARLERARELVASAEKGKGPQRRVYRLASAGEAALEDELREAMARLMEAFDAARPRARPRKSAALPAPIGMVSGSRLSGVEIRMLGRLAQSCPRQTYLFVPPGALPPARPPPGLVVLEGTWSAIPLREEHLLVLFVNELPPSEGLPRAAREWARVLAPGGTVHVVAPAGLPMGLDPFVDFLAQTQARLFPDVSQSPDPAIVKRALAAGFEGIEESREAGQRIWTARRPGGRAEPRPPRARSKA